MNNIYVGARYVPLICGAWNNERGYEPLSVVTHLGNSYTSKCFVPNGVDISDEKYWVCTGNFNAQLEQMRIELVRVSAELERLSKLVGGVE